MRRLQAILSKISTRAIVAIIIILTAEIAVFNLGHWRTCAAQSVFAGDFSYGSGLENKGGGHYLITDPENAVIDIPISAANNFTSNISALKSDSADSQSDESDSADSQSDSFQSDSFQPADSQPAQLESLRLVPADGECTFNTAKFYTSNNGGKWRDLGEGVWFDRTRELTYTHLNETQYILAGQKSDNNRLSDTLRISFEKEDKGKTVSLSRVEFNPTVPFKIAPERLLIMSAAAAFIIAFRPKSKLYRMKLNLALRSQKILFASIIVAQSLILLIVSQLTGGIFFKSDNMEFGYGFQHWFEPAQYQRLGESILNGRAWIDLPVDNALLQMDNPYNYNARQDLNLANGAVFFWDHAYFQGHYYSYFGVIPAVILFAPYQALTGSWLPISVASVIFAVGFTIFAVLLILKLVKRYFPEASLGMSLLSLIAFMFANSLWYYVFCPSFYGIPVLSSMMFTCAGLYFWLCARRVRSGSEENKTSRKPGEIYLSNWRVALGSFCMAMNVGCRPHFAAAALLAFPIFWDEIRHSRLVFSKKTWKTTLAAILPFAAVIIPLLAYNYARFGSFLDFGSNYNLTAYDMTRDRPSLFLLGAMLFLQLFQPINLTAAFPFVQAADNAVAAPCEPSFGGFFALAPFALFGLFFYAVRGRLKKRGVYAMTVMSLVLGFAIVFADVKTCGVNNRYIGDSGYLFMFAAIFAALCMEEEMREFIGRKADKKAEINADKNAETEVKKKAAALKKNDAKLSSSKVFSAKVSSVEIPAVARLWNIAVFAAVFISVAVTFCGFFCPNRYDSLATTDPFLFNYVKSWFMGLCA